MINNIKSMVKKAWYYEFVLFIKLFFKLCIEYNTKRKSIISKKDINESIIDEEYSFLELAYNLLN